MNISNLHFKYAKTDNYYNIIKAYFNKHSLNFLLQPKHKISTNKTKITINSNCYGRIF